MIVRDPADQLGIQVFTRPLGSRYSLSHCINLLIWSTVIHWVSARPLKVVWWSVDGNFRDIGWDSCHENQVLCIIELSL